MKKLISLLLCLVLCLSFMGAAFAELKSVDEANLSSAYLTAVVHVANDVDFSSVGTLTYAFEPVPNESVPAADVVAITDQPITLSRPSGEDNIAKGKISLDSFLSASMFPHAGLYEYTVSQKAISGVPAANERFNKDKTLPTYDMKIQVINDTTVTPAVLKIASVTVRLTGENNKQELSEKYDHTGFNFENWYEKIVEDADGVLTVNKVISGTYADSTKTFAISVTVVLPDRTSADDVAVASGATWDAASLTASANLKGGESIKFTKLPAGTSFSVTEQEDVAYKFKFTGDFTAESGDNDYQAVSVAAGSTETTVEVSRAGSIVVDENQKPVVTIDNHRDYEPDTGIAVYNLPFVLLVVLALTGMAVYFVADRRRETNF